MFCFVHSKIAALELSFSVCKCIQNVGGSILNPKSFKTALNLFHYFSVYNVHCVFVWNFWCNLTPLTKGLLV